jgi:phosphoglucosamine mutase
MSTSRKYFGTDGVRGPYGSATMNETFAWRLSVAAARWLQGKGITNGRVLIGRDTRISGASLAQALADGLAHGGFQPVSLDILPTPAVSRAVRTEDAVLGVVVTASHNPAADNGIKFFGSNGIKLTDEEEALIETFLPESRTDTKAAQWTKIDAVANYLESVKGILPATLDGWKIVLDTANGATVHTSSRVLRSFKADVVAIGSEFDGVNINREVGSEHPEKMCAAVKFHGARLGVAHDGDGDRCLLCDEHGKVLDGDEMLTILALHALKQGKLANKILVVTVQSNLGVEAAVTAAGGRVVRTPVGDRYVIERMLAEAASLGGESSGHVICSNISPTGDGLVAALKIIEVMLVTGLPLSELRRGLIKFPQLSSALAVREKKPLESIRAIQSAIKGVEDELGKAGRVLVRYSGTEPKLRLLVEGPTQTAVQAAMDKLVAAVRADLEVIEG